MLAAALLASGGVAFAQDGAHPPRGAGLTQDRAARQAERAFARLDAKGDGALDAADRAALQRAAFERLDADRDGAVSFAEFEAAREDRGELRAERRGRGRSGLARLAGAGVIARTADADADGTVSQAEFRAAALARFAAADADGDGRVTRAERRSSREATRPLRRSPAG
jgi:hypothetical protein